MLLIYFLMIADFYYETQISVKICNDNNLANLSNENYNNFNAVKIVKPIVNETPLMNRCYQSFEVIKR